MPRDAFLPSLRDTLHAKGRSLDPPAEEALSRGWAAARREHPAVAVDGESFAAWLADRLPDADPKRDPSRLRVPDLYLAAACVAGDPAALAAFDRSFGEELTRIARRFEHAGATADELVQSIRTRLVVGDADRPPKLTEYAGFGFLENWVRVAATRAFIDGARAEKSRRRRETDAGGLDRGATDDLEVAFLKQAYRAHFRAAFAQAVRALPAQDRALLRQHTVERRSIDELGALHGIHRATAARRLDAARTTLLRSTRAALQARLALPSDEIDSVLRLVRDNLDASISGLFATEDPAAPAAGSRRDAG